MYIRFSVWYLIISNKKQLLTEKIEVAIKRIGDEGDDRHCPWWFQIYREENVDDQENIRKIMENSCIWDFLEFLSKSWVLYSRKLVSHYRTLSPKIENLEFLSSRPSFNKYIHSVSHFDKGVLKNSRKAFFIQYIYIYK